MPKPVPLKIEMVARFATKPALQQILTRCRQQGYAVTKLAHGYEVKATTGQTVLKAMNGRSGYLVRLAPSVFQGV